MNVAVSPQCLPVHHKASLPCWHGVQHHGRASRPAARTDMHALAALSLEIERRCGEWVALDHDESSKAEVQQAIAAEDETLLLDALGQRLVFGTCAAPRNTIPCRLWPFRLSSAYRTAFEHDLLNCRYSRAAWHHGIRVQSHEQGCGAADHPRLLQLPTTPSRPRAYNSWSCHR